MKKLVGTIAVAAATALTVVAGPTQAASADIPEPAHCTGTAVPRCVEMHYDPANHRIRAHAGILDIPNQNANYDVDVLWVWVTLRGAVSLQTDPDGPFAASDTGMSPLVNCNGGAAVAEYGATFWWRNTATGAVDTGDVRDTVVVCN